MLSGIHRYEERWLPALAALRPTPAGAEPVSALRALLADPIRGKGENTRVWLEQDQPMGVVGWVAANVPRNGELYGSPLLAAHRPALDGLIAALLREAAAAGARFVHVAASDNETDKREALLAHGFQPTFHFLTLRAASSSISPRTMPAGWRPIALRDMDWPQLAELFARAFADVPHVPYHSAEALRQDWQEADVEASQVWAAPDGSYQAFLQATADGRVEAVGVEAAHAGQGVAAAMYGAAAGGFLARGVGALEAMVADINVASLALHRKLGFAETARKQIYRRALEQASG
ncbi:GNAT family N-acetyltransferase [Chromobacterium alticapitis]|nr:GNAT family N-acetyltransferase [Chromobacterium alticapitis]